MHARAKVAAAALGAMLALSSCSLAASITTSNQYSPSDGIGVQVGGVRAENLLLVSSEEGAPAALVGYLYNDNDSAVSVDVAVGETSQSYSLPPRGSVQLGLADGSQAFVTTAPASPGLIGSFTVTVKDRAAQTGTLPIVDGTLPEYQPILDALGTATN